jgi:hypothetical protein
MSDPRPIARVRFVDGIERAVYEDADGRQYVVGYDGERVYGQWLPPADEPMIVGPADLSARPQGRAAPPGAC